MQQWLNYALGGSPIYRQPPTSDASTVTYLNMVGNFVFATSELTPAPLTVQTSKASNSDMSNGCSDCTNAGGNALAGTNGAGMNGAYYIFLPSYEIINGVTTQTGGTTFFAVIDNAFMYTGNNYTTGSGAGFIFGYMYAIFASMRGTQYGYLTDFASSSITFDMIGPFENNLTESEIVSCNPFASYYSSTMTGYLITQQLKSGSSSGVVKLFENLYVQGSVQPTSVTCTQLTGSEINTITFGFGSSIPTSSLYIKSCSNDSTVAVAQDQVVTALPSIA